MKNRKLFAIITLVAFMLTMMPMMAFAATASGSSIAVDDASAKNDGSDKLEFIIDLDGAIASGQLLAIFAERNGALSDADTIVINGKTATDDGLGYAVFDDTVITAAGEYTVEVTSTVAGTVKVSAYIISNIASGAETGVAALYNGSNEFTKTALVGNGATGKFNTTSSSISITATVTAQDADFVLAGSEGAGYTGAQANNGLHVYKVNVAVTKGGAKAAGEKVTVAADKNGVYISETELTTSATGKADFKVSASKPGNYLLSITVGNEVKEFKVKFDATDATKGVFSWTTADTIATGIEETVAKLTFTDGNGNNIAGNSTNLAAINGAFEVQVVGAPEDSALEDTTKLLELNSGNEYVLKLNPDFAGEYTVKVINTTTGVADTTTFKAAEYGKTVSATISYPSNTFLLGEQTQAATVKVVDQNGVKKNAGSKSFSYSGVGVTDFDKTNGQVTFSTDDKYAGNQIVVTVVADSKYAASATLTIANEPAQLVFTDAQAAIGQEVKVDFQVVDIAGKATAIAADANYDVRVENALIIDRPAGALVSVDADALGNDGKAEKDLLKTGKGSIKVVSDTADVVKVNVILGVYADALATEADFYLAGVATVNVGGVVVEDNETSTVTLIIGSTTFVANGKAEVAPIAPAVVDGRTLVPVRAFAQATGAEVVYDANTKVITITAEGLLAQMTVGSNILTVNGQTTVMDSAATLIDGSTVLPVRYAGQALGYDFECAYGVDGAVTSVTMFK